MTVVYADSVFLLNGAMDYVLFLVTARLAGIPLKRRRYALAALLGAFYAVSVFLPGLNFLSAFPAKLAVGVLLARLILGFDTKFNVLGKTSVVMAGLGTFLYAFTGWLTIFGGADYFLNYDYMPIVLEPKHEMHAMGIFLIEIGVAICVMMTIINLLDAIVKRGEDDGSVE